MSKTPQGWQATLDLDELPDTEWVQMMNALEGQETIDGGGLEAQGLTALPLIPDEIGVALVVESAALRMGYQAKLILEPLESGPTIVAALGDGKS